MMTANELRELEKTLKPCKCGIPAMIYESKFYRKFFVVGCEAENGNRIHTMPTKEYDTPQEAVQAWNERKE
jgi:hypothetical protein